jgi:hypothetical protein
MKKVNADGRSNYFLPLSKVKKLDAWLKERYSVDCFVDFDKYYKSNIQKTNLSYNKLILKIKVSI